MANLTQQEFLEIADLYRKGINLWCTETAPVQVLGVTVPFTDKLNDNVVNTLQQVETITVPVDNDPGSTVELKITSRVIRGTAPYRYYYFTVEPRDITTYISPELNEVIQNGQVILLPNLRGGSFYVSDYNVTLNTTQNSRLSDYIIRSTSITFADIQDSMYSDTGWINARYEGTSTNSQTYSSIDPAIQGSSLQGTYYPIQTSDVEINNIDVSERPYLEYFHTSLQAYPSYSLETVPLFQTDGVYGTVDTSITVTPLSQNNPFKLYQPGDLLQKVGGKEVIKVITMYRLSAANDYRIEVVRGWNNTLKQVLVNSDVLDRIVNIRMFELEKNKPSPTKQGKIRLKDTGYVVHTDLLGYIISGSTPQIN